MIYTIIGLALNVIGLIFVFFSIALVKHTNSIHLARIGAGFCLCGLAFCLFDLYEILL